MYKRVKKASRDMRVVENSSLRPGSSWFTITAGRQGAPPNSPPWLAGSKIHWEQCKLDAQTPWAAQVPGVTCNSVPAWFCLSCEGLSRVVFLNRACSSGCQGGMANTQQGGRKNYQGSVQWCEGVGAMPVVHISS